MKLKDFPRYHIIFLIRTLAGRKVLYKAYLQEQY